MENNGPETDNGWGGRRQGAGRKRITNDRVFRLSLRLDIASYNKLIDYCERTRQSKCQAMREILKKLR